MQHWSSHWGYSTGMDGFFFVPFLMMFLSLAWVLLVLWVVYDVATRRDMQAAEKVLWIGVSFVFWVLGPIAYILVVKLSGQPVFRPSGKRLSELERLADLHERGVLTDEEFAEMKDEFLEHLRR